MISSELAYTIMIKTFKVTDTISGTANALVRGEIECTFVQFPIIQFFFEKPLQPPTVKTLCAVTGMMSGAVSQAVDQLVRDGLLMPVPGERRSSRFQATEKLLATREKAQRHFFSLMDAMRSWRHIPPEDEAVARDFFIKLAASRIGCENNVMKQPSDLSVPGLIPLDESCRTDLENIPGWMQGLHFTTNLRRPVLLHYYGRRGRMTVAKLKILNLLIILSYRDLPPPTVKELAARCHVSSGAISQTLDSLCQESMVERLQSPLDRRVIQVRLSPQGLRLRRQCMAACTKFMMNILENEPPEHVVVIERMLDWTLEFLRTDGKQFLIRDEGDLLGDLV